MEMLHRKGESWMETAIDVASIGFYEFKVETQEVFMDERVRNILGYRRKKNAAPATTGSNISILDDRRKYLNLAAES